MRTHLTANTAALLCSVAVSLWASEAEATPVYGEVAVIPVPSVGAPVNPTNSFSFDISFFAGNTQLDYVADRANASIDVFSAATNSFVEHITGTGANAFVGSTPVAPTIDSGPNGVLVANGVVYGGDGNSTVKAFQLTPGNPPASGSPITVGAPAQGRADEMGFDPADHILAVASDHGTPSPYISLIDTTTNMLIKQVVFDGTGGTPNATGGIEQTVWNGNTHLFYINVPQIGPASDPGGIAVMNSAGTVIKVYDFASFGISSCGPAGLALGVGNQLIVGCGSTQSFIFDPTANGGAGEIVGIPFAGVTADELAFDPTNDLAFFTSSGTLAIIDTLTGQFLQDLTTGAGSHSVSVDPVSNEVFVPVRNTSSTDPRCSTGCIDVFAPIPEPSTLPLFGGGLLGLVALAWRKKRKLPSRLHFG